MSATNVVKIIAPNGQIHIVYEGGPFYDAALVLVVAAQQAEKNCRDAHESGYVRGYEDGQRDGWDAGKKYGENLVEQEIRRKIAGQLSQHMRLMDMKARELRDENHDDRGYIIEKAVGYYSFIVGCILTGDWPVSV